MIRASRLTFAYPDGAPVVFELDLELFEGEILAVIGPNGSGKSTLLKLLAGLLSPESGSVHFDDRPLSALGRIEIAREIGYVPQAIQVGLPFTVAEVVLFGRHPYQKPFRLERPEDIAAADEALELTGLRDLAHRAVNTLSGGEQQRVMIARAIAQDTRVLLLDEPTAALDLKHEVRIWELLERLATERGKLVVGVTHHVNLASLFSPRLLVLKAGRTVAVGSPRALIVRDLLEAVYETPLRIVSSATETPLVLPERPDAGFRAEGGGERGEEGSAVASRVSGGSAVWYSGRKVAESRNRQAIALPVLSPRRLALTVGSALLLLLAVLVAAPLIGPTRVDLSRAFDTSIPVSENPDAGILFVVRLPRTLLAAMVGAALAASGLAFQSLLRNPLASPFTLGISGGAAVATALAIRLGLDGSLGPFTAQTSAALAGSLTAATLVYALAQVRGYLAPSTLLLAGVTLHFFFSSLILLIQYTADFTQSYQMVRWVMGGFDLIAIDRLAAVTPLVGLGLVGLLLVSRQFNVLALGDEAAQSLGVAVGRTRKWAFAAASVATGAAISVSGPILFVGLMVPHLLRLLLGSDHRLLMPCSIFVGGVLVVLSDTAARTVLAPTEIPAGVVTALLGGPFFLWLLLRHKLRGLYPGDSSV